MVKKLLLVVVFLLLGAVLVFWLGAYTSMDHDQQHAAATAALPDFSSQPGSSQTPTLVQIQANELVFRARVAGFPGPAGNVILLHGFPETSIMYESTMESLAAAGYAVVAFDQRGYSPGARPTDINDYQIEHLVSDVRAVAEAVGFDHFHLVGHDWGAAVGWTLVMADPSVVDSWSALSIPHLVAYGEAMQNDSDQQQRSSYIGFFRLPWLPETLFTFNDLKMLKTSVYPDHIDIVQEEYLRVFAEPGALTAALNWYRAGDLQPATSGVPLQPDIEIPVLFVWGTQDPVVGDQALAAQQKYLLGPYREVSLDTGHWLLQTRGAQTNAALLKHIQDVDRPDSLESNNPRAN